MFKRGYGWLIMVCLIFGLSGTFAQDDACPTIVQTALRTVDELCSPTGRNQACYGNLALVAEPQPGIESLKFNAPGDIADIIQIGALRLSAMDEARGEWGVALMRLQANLPDTLPGQNVTILLFGDVELRSASLPTEYPVAVSGSSAVNVRGGPSTDAPVVAGLSPGESLTAIGRDADGQWLHVRLEDGRSGWIKAELLRSEFDLQKLNVVEAGKKVYGPMQAFYLRTGVGDAPCVAAPDSGIVIQTPRGVGSVELSVNGANIVLGSTMYIGQSNPGDSLVFNVLEGEARVTAFDVTRVVPAGARISLPLDENLTVSQPPGSPEPYSADALASLASVVEILPETIQIAPAMSAAAVEDLLAETGGCRVQSADRPNVRSGPGLDYGVVERLSAETQEPVAQAAGTDGGIWYELSPGRWVRSDVVQAAGSCENLPEEVNLPPTPTPASTSVSPAGGTGRSSSITLHPWGCEPTEVSAGRITLSFGVGRWPTRDEAAAAIGGGMASLAVDGRPLENLRREGYTIHTGYGDPGWGDATQGEITLEPGVYTFSGSWIDGARSCVITVK